MTGNGPDGDGAARFPASDAAPSRAIAVAEAFAAAAKLAPGDAVRLAIIVEELVCNVVEHGEAVAGSEIALALTREGATLRLTLTDEGAPFDPGKAPEPGPLPPERGGGAGLAIVRSWARIERYERVFGVNRLVLLLPLTT